MKAVFLTVYPFLCILLPCIFCRSFLYYRKKVKIPAGYRVWTDLFFLYLALAMEVAGPGTIWDIGKYDETIRIQEINLIPFHSDGGVTYILNVIMFMPMGFLLPLIWKNFRKLGKTAAAGAAFSLLIEICQLFNKRATDIDDLLMNTLGTLAGYGIWAIFSRVVGNRKRTQKNGLVSCEPFLYLVFAVAGRFFLYNWRAFI